MEFGLESTGSVDGPHIRFPLTLPLDLEIFTPTAQDLNLDRLFKPIVGQLWKATTSSGFH